MARVVYYPAKKYTTKSNTVESEYIFWVINQFFQVTNRYYRNTFYLLILYNSQILVALQLNKLSTSCIVAKKLVLRGEIILPLNYPVDCR
ncbi:hypothetical protein FWK35_00023075, partial [Aphis craccivora]